MRVFITGGTGLIGTRLIALLQDRHDHVVLLTRRAGQVRDRFGQDCTLVEGNPMEPGPWMDALGECDAVINLVGEGIFNRRWNEGFKKLMYDSRVKSTDLVVKALGKNPRTATGAPKVLVNASAIGYYGPCGDEELTEDSPPGNDTLARLVIDWEKSARAAEPLGVRVALMRIGVVLDKAGGALKQMLLPFKLGLGGPIGSGKQWMSWIHYADLVGVMVLALDHTGAAGPLNGTAPHPVPNKVFSKALGRALHRPAFMPIPALGLRLRFGQVAEILTTGQRVLPTKALALGYRFRFPDIDSAFAHLWSDE